MKYDHHYWKFGPSTLRKELPPMRHFPRVALLLDSARKFDAGLLRGIARYVNLHQPREFLRPAAFCQRISGLVEAPSLGHRCWLAQLPKPVGILACNDECQGCTDLALLEPQQGLGDGDVALHFRVGRIGRELLPEIEIGLFAQRQAGEEQARLTRRPALLSLHVRLARPFRFVGEVRIQVGDGLADRRVRPGFRTTTESSPGPDSTWHSMTMLSSWKIE